MSTPQAKAEDAKPLGFKAKLAELTCTISHVTVVTFTMAYMVLRFLVFDGPLPGFLYRGVFVAASAALGLVVYQKYTTGQFPHEIRPRDESVQYLYLAGVWLFTKERYFASLPFAILSFFHALTCDRSYLLPAMYATSPRGLAQRINYVVEKYKEPFTKFAAQVEFGQLIVLILTVLGAPKKVWRQFVLYALFLRCRYEVSRYIQDITMSVEVRIDNWVPSGTDNALWLAIKAAVAAIPHPEPLPEPTN
ncbi:Nucleoporin POM33 [Wickerhamiella sorbophila]|uniref:Nucleoporin POM33 n=1 Tax=Wickerhamiella sorbophila TaxID=45607 RepID=A0A2T0FBW2_9ASCO|nr:Nucleoporin POM33 [Wickerhamiella sorbophila]PRT52486.1 Nucleoporin POM33 [Wickerhamiella sorbophila]